MKKLIGMSLISLGLLVLAGCGTTKGVSAKYFDASMSKNDVKAKVAQLEKDYKQKSVKELKKAGELLSPEKGCLVFGYKFEKVIALQQNPEFGYRFYNAYIEKTGALGINSFYYAFQPLPVGTQFKLFYAHYVEHQRSVVTGNADITHYLEGGISGSDMTLTKPGLYYLDVSDKNHEHEEKALKEILGFYSGTEWESVIKARIKELKNVK